MHRTVAIGCILISACLAALYGVMTADTTLYAGIRGVDLFAVAVVGGCCPAWACAHWNGRRYGQAGFTWLVCGVCLLVTLGGGIGTIVGSADSSTAQRAKAVDATKDARAELATLLEKAKALPAHRPAAAVEAEIIAAKASRAYQLSNGCDPDSITAKAKREACTAFRKLESELATAKAAQDMDAKAAELRTRLGKAPAVQSANPQAAALSQLLGIGIDAAVAWYALVASLALELAGMAAMMRAESDARSAMPLPIAEPKPQPAANVVSIVAGDPAKFALACLAPSPGNTVAVAELHGPYAAWCARQGQRAFGKDEFERQFLALAEFAGVGRRQVRGKTVCINLALIEGAVPAVVM